MTDNIKKNFDETENVLEYVDKNPTIDNSIIEICALDKTLDCQKETEIYNDYIKNREGSLYSEIIYNLVGLKYDENIAVKKWQELLKHKYLISYKLGRNVGIRVAALDYFSNITKELKNYTIMDTYKYRMTKVKTIIDLHTGALNKDFMYKFLTNIEAESFKDENIFFSLLFFDIDDFKKFNDNYGHILGDILLIDLVKLIKNKLKPNDFIFRYGGEEFVIYFCNTNKTDAINKSNELRNIIAKTNFQNALKMDSSIYITVSGGVASWKEDSKDLSELIELADGYLFQSKRYGKNRISYSNQNLSSLPFSV